MNQKVYTSAPLPFQGQKRRFVKAFKNALYNIEIKSIRLIIDLFGGSGLLSHTAKWTLPETRVIYNDYDNYHVRIENITTTNRLLSKIRCITKKIPSGQRLSKETKREIFDIRPLSMDGNKP